jgi:uncharacterized membrane protein YjgN (DUF898 family)
MSQPPSPEPPPLPETGPIGASTSLPNAILPSLSAQHAAPTVATDWRNEPVERFTPPIPPSTPFTWQGSPWSLTGACVVNAILMILTIGIYGFWGRTEIRRRMWSSVRFLGEPLAYHGTAMELLKGFFAVMLAVLLPLFVLGTVVVIVFGQASGWFIFYQMGLFLGVYPILAAIAYYRARRYRLSRTSWRGIRGSVNGSSTSYGFLSWALTLAQSFTAGWISPYRSVALNSAIVKDTQLGDRQLTFMGTSGPLYGPFALMWFGTVVLYFVVFGLFAYVVGTKVNTSNPDVWKALNGRDWASLVIAFTVAITLWSIMSSFYYAKLYNLCASSTIMLPARTGEPALRFRLDIGGMKLIWLFVTNMMITYLSLYILRPVATARSMKYFVENLRLEGPFDAATVGQNRALIDQSGEGLGQAFDLDAF